MPNTEMKSDKSSVPTSRPPDSNVNAKLSAADKKPSAVLAKGQVEQGQAGKIKVNGVAAAVKKPTPQAKKDEINDLELIRSILRLATILLLLAIIYCCVMWWGPQSSESQSSDDNLEVLKSSMESKIMALEHNFNRTQGNLQKTREELAALTQNLTNNEYRFDRLVEELGRFNRSIQQGQQVAQRNLLQQLRNLETRVERKLEDQMNEMQGVREMHVGLHRKVNHILYSGTGSTKKSSTSYNICVLIISILLLGEF